ncbi:hypothetical protein CP8484711_2280B, partial [Chlamydia psittaci 84-8471/1]
AAPEHASFSFIISLYFTISFFSNHRSLSRIM